MKISGVVIAKNEEEMIADCLDSIAFCDEVLVVDNESTDRTAEIAERMGAKVRKIAADDFSKLRNFGLKQATGDYILYIDSDERVSGELRKNILNSLDAQTVAYKLRRQNFYLGKNPWPKIEQIERLFLKSKLKGWKGRLHESPEYIGETKVLDGFLLHFTHRNLSQMLNKTIEWSDVEAKNRFEAGHPRITWWRFPRVMITTFIDYYFIQRGYRVGTVGLIESVYQAFSIMITYAKLWELQNKEVKE